MPPPLPGAPAPPGSYSPEDYLVPGVIGWSLLGVAAGLLLLGCSVMRQYRSAKRDTSERGALHSACCCFIECCRHSNWNQVERNGHGVPYGEEDAQMLTDDKARQRDGLLVAAMQPGVGVATTLMPPLHLAVVGHKA